MKTQKYIMTAVVLIVLFGTVSSSFAKPRKYGYRGNSHVKNGYRGNSHVKNSYRAKNSHRRYAYQRPRSRSSISISLPRLRLFIGGDSRTRVFTALSPRVIEPAKINVWIPNYNGSLTSVTLTRRFSGYTGPLGEYYQSMPTAEQLQMLYGLKLKNTSYLYPHTGH